MDKTDWSKAISLKENSKLKHVMPSSSIECGSLVPRSKEKRSPAIKPQLALSQTGSTKLSGSLKEVNQRFRLK